MTENGYQIGEVVKGIPARGQHQLSGSKYASIWASVEKLADGEALPVVFPSVEQATNCTPTFAKTAASRGLKVARRGATVYFTKVSHD